MRAISRSITRLSTNRVKRRRKSDNNRVQTCLMQSFKWNWRPLVEPMQWIRRVCVCVCDCIKQYRGGTYCRMIGKDSLRLQKKKKRRRAQQQLQKKKKQANSQTDRHTTEHSCTVRKKWGCTNAIITYKKDECVCVRAPETEEVGKKWTKCETLQAKPAFSDMCGLVSAIHTNWQKKKRYSNHRVGLQRRNRQEITPWWEVVAVRDRERDSREQIKLPSTFFRSISLTFDVCFWR